MMATKPDALMFREDEHGFTVRTVGEHRMATYLEAGWTLLLSSSQVRALDIQETYAEDTFRWQKHVRRT